MSYPLQFPIEAIGSKVDLPVIDISEFSQDLDAEDLTHLRDHPVIAKLRKACREWGFFYLVNHGIRVEILDNIRNATRPRFIIHAHRG
ncbi:hypothetical protein SUGI_0702460 [Cryptomeria japonica]|nr:hypothetical protein SUGI_0702460 [Cryptomeria japonica]